MQLRALQGVASSTNAKVVVPYEAAGLIGAAQVLVDALKDAGEHGGSGNGQIPHNVTAINPSPAGNPSN
ncbi:MAG: hypothetical protein ACYCV7_10760, partial [Acidimicrobiales bacterium]